MVEKGLSYVKLNLVSYDLLSHQNTTAKDVRRGLFAPEASESIPMDSRENPDPGDPGPRESSPLPENEGN